MSLFFLCAPPLLPLPHTQLERGSTLVSLGVPPVGGPRALQLVQLKETEGSGVSGISCLPCIARQGRPTICLGSAVHPRLPPRSPKPAQARLGSHVGCPALTAPHSCSGPSALVLRYSSCLGSSSALLKQDQRAQAHESQCSVLCCVGGEGVVSGGRETFHCFPAEIAGRKQNPE